MFTLEKFTSDVLKVEAAIKLITTGRLKELPNVDYHIEVCNAAGVLTGQPTLAKLFNSKHRDAAVMAAYDLAVN